LNRVQRDRTRERVPSRRPLQPENDDRRPDHAAEDPPAMLLASDAGKE
jgi:hypothetical protein